MSEIHAKSDNSFWLTWNLVFLTVICDVLGIVALKVVINRLGEVPLDSLGSIGSYFLEFVSYPLAIGGGILFLAAPFFFTAALTRMEISTAYPAQVGLNLSGLVLMAVLVLGETLTIGKVAGMLLIATSIVILYRS